MKLLLKCIYCFFALLWLVSLLSGPFFTFFTSDITCELPWFDLSNVIVDQHRNTYIGLPFYGRVQSYDKEGNYRKQWHIGKGSGGSFRLNLSPDQYIEIATTRGRSLNTFDSNGKLIEVKQDTDIFHKLDGKRTQSFIDTYKNEYFTKDEFVIPKIVRKTRVGKEQIVATMPWYLFFVHPISTLSFLLISGSVQWIYNKKNK